MGSVVSQFIPVYRVFGAGASLSLKYIVGLEMYVLFRIVLPKVVVKVIVDTMFEFVFQGAAAKWI